jgi:hypothetical protein
VPIRKRVRPSNVFEEKYEARQRGWGNPPPLFFGIGQVVE